MKFSAAYDRTANLVTGGAIWISLFLLGGTLLPMMKHEMVFTSFAIFLPLICMLVWAVHPDFYSIDSDAVKVHTPLLKIRIRNSSILEMRQIQFVELGSTARTIGSGGLFGYFGLYYSGVFGNFIMWCKNKEHLVLIVTTGKTYVISPSDPRGFIERFRSFM